MNTIYGRFINWYKDLKMKIAVKLVNKYLDIVLIILVKNAEDKQMTVDEYIDYNLYDY